MGKRAKGAPNPVFKQIGMGTLLVIALWCGFELLQGARSKPRVPFTGTTLAGEKWELQAFKGKQPVLVNFFGLSCPACQEEFPHLVQLHKKYAPRGLAMAMVAQDTAGDIRKITHLTEAGITILGDSNPVFEQYGIDSIPHTVLFDKEGSVVLELNGYTFGDEKRVDEALAKLLPTSTASAGPPTADR